MKRIEKQLECFRHIVGQHVHVHSSLKAVGEVDGRGEALLDGLIDFFTQGGGMISFPTHTWNTNVLDLRNTDTCMGVLSKLALQRSDGVRTMNPTHSMIIFGNGAKEYAKWDENVSSCIPPNGCYGKLYDEDGYVFLMGVGQEKNTYLHAVEEALDIPDRIKEELCETTIIDKEGKVTVKPIHYLFEEYDDISRHFGKLEKAFRHHNCILDGMIGNAKVQLCSARKMREVLELIHKRSNYVEIFLDDEPLPEEWYI